MDIKLFASTFGKNCSKIRKNCIPIEMGAANRSNFIYPTKDNNGDNISKKNPYFGELTALYWIWKIINSPMTILWDSAIITNT